MAAIAGAVYAGAALVGAGAAATLAVTIAAGVVSYLVLLLRYERNYVGELRSLLLRRRPRTTAPAIASTNVA
jgi:hypothetical protein